MTENYDSSKSRLIKFGILLVFGVPSLLSAIYVIYSFLKIPSLRKRFQNQTFIILVFVILFDLIVNAPIALSFFARGYIWPESEVFCHIWQCMDYILTSCTIWCKAIFTFERYILIFYPNRLRSQQQKILLHYLPIISINSYLILFYLLNTVIHSCDSQPDFRRYLCGGACIDREGVLPTFNWFFNILLPVFIIIFGSFCLLLRVLWTRRKMQRNLRNWSKNWKMIVQLLGIAIIYTLIWLPIITFSFIEISHSGTSSTYIVEYYLDFLTYLCEMCVPIVALFLTPEIARLLYGCMRPNVVDIASVTINQHSTHQL